jgi:6-phosphofructokinase 1
VHALASGADGVMLSFQAHEMSQLPLATPLQRVRTVPPDSALMLTARALGIAFGDARAS